MIAEVVGSCGWIYPRTIADAIPCCMVDQRVQQRFASPIAIAEKIRERGPLLQKFRLLQERRPRRDFQRLDPHHRVGEEAQRMPDELAPAAFPAFPHKPLGVRLPLVFQFCELAGQFALV